MLQFVIIGCRWFLCFLCVLFLTERDLVLLHVVLRQTNARSSRWQKWPNRDIIERNRSQQWPLITMAARRARCVSRCAVNAQPARRLRQWSTCFSSRCPVLVLWLLWCWCWCRCSWWWWYYICFVIFLFVVVCLFIFVNLLFCGYLFVVHTQTFINVDFLLGWFAKRYFSNLCRCCSCAASQAVRRLWRQVWQARRRRANVAACSQSPAGSISWCVRLTNSYT